jgi:hypothetical protein
VYYGSRETRRQRALHLCGLGFLVSLVARCRLRHAQLLHYGRKRDEELLEGPDVK